MPSSVSKYGMMTPIMILGVRWDCISSHDHTLGLSCRASPIPGVSYTLPETKRRSLLQTQVEPETYPCHVWCRRHSSYATFSYRSLYPPSTVAADLQFPIEKRDGDQGVISEDGVTSCDVGTTSSIKYSRLRPST